MNSTEIAQDFTNICRCCMEVASYDLFKTYFENEPLAKLLSVCTNQRISKNDIFPKNICQTCLQSLIAAYIFKEKVIKTQQALLSIARVVDRVKTKKNGNVSKDHTYHHDKQQLASTQQLSGHTEQHMPTMSHVKVEIENQDDDYLLHEQMQLENAGMEVKYIKQNGDGEEQEFWLQEVPEGEGSNHPSQSEQYEDMNNILHNVKVLNPVHFADGNTYVEGDAQEGEHEGYQTIEFIDEDVNYVDESSVETKQKEKIHVCRVCHEGFFTSRELNNHAQTLGHAQRCCIICYQAFHSYSSLIKHCMDTGHTRPTMYKCPYCFKKCDNKQILQSHIKNHMKTKIIKVTKDKKGNLGCQVCRTAFISVSDLRQHYKDNKESHLTCHVCLEKFNNLTKLDTHLKNHDIEKPFGCEICGARFNFQINFERHLKKHTQSETLYKCQFCPKVFSDEPSVEEHEKLHEVVEDNRSHHCTECGKLFTTAGFLKKHVERFHLGLNFNKTQRVPFECELCGKVLSCKATLYSHMKNVHEKSQKSFTCEICGKILKTKTSLELHTNYHNGNCPFKCGICGKAFTNATTLKSHSLIHTNERPHECQVCHKTFKQKPHLTTHILTIHTALKLFKCDYCEKTFALKGNLSQHLKTHTGCESPFVCSVCNKAFYFASRLRKHEKIHMKQ
ncbi:zinc finger protein 431-like isoform X2 [Coccinella septempunctata]|uniref:zinc finger protein 431-like isoform X2 n=1 Tax=Coccinella septempunctata TaxID=41139 RepID=UPI001D0649A6|nr:zinc finger protein 431-like isoform X2 [Coccinella septempunctata]